MPLVVEKGLWQAILANWEGPLMLLDGGQGWRLAKLLKEHLRQPPAPDDTYPNNVLRDPTNKGVINRIIDLLCLGNGIQANKIMLTDGSSAQKWLRLSRT